MSRYRSYGNLDTEAQLDGDVQFTRIDAKHDRGILPAGTVARSENKRLRTGRAVTRPGTGTPAWANPGGYSAIFVGSGVYSNPNGEEVLLIAEAGKSFVWKLRYDAGPTTVPLSSASPSAPAFWCQFVQAFDKVIYLRGSTLTPLVWDGVAAGGFVPITKSDPADTSTLLIPNCVAGESFENRILYQRDWGSDEIIMSDILDYTSYDPIFGVFRINAGEADRIMRIMPYSPESIVVFMERSCHMLSNFTVDPAMAQQQVISHTLGLAAPRAVVQVGADLIFLNNKGIYRLSQVFERNMATSPTPISDPIQPIIDRINWASTSIGISSAETFGDYVFFAVPLDDEVQPHSILVYNTVTDSWESAPDKRSDPNFWIGAMHCAEYYGQRQLFGINQGNHRVHVLEEGVNDETVTDTGNPIIDVIETRGYGGNMGGGLGSFKSFRRALVGLETMSPYTIITAISDGRNEEKVLALVQRDPTKSYIWGKAGSTDVNDPKRQDYYDASLPAPVLQAALERHMIHQIGRWCSIRVINYQGICNVLGVGVDGRETHNVVRVAA